jgi:hypothetical protein
MSDTAERLRDPIVRECLRALRKCCPPEARSHLDRLANRLKYQNKIIGTYDDRFAAQALSLIDAGKMEAASTSAWLLFDDERRIELLAMINVDTTQAAQAAQERIAHAVAMGRIIVGDE